MLKLTLVTFVRGRLSSSRVSLGLFATRLRAGNGSTVVVAKGGCKLKVIVAMEVNIQERSCLYYVDHRHHASFSLPSNSITKI